MRKPNHEVMSLARHRLPGAYLGRYNYTRAQPGLRDHAHAATMEICYLVKGRQTYRVGDEVFRMRGGDVFLTFPNELHSTGVAPQEKGALYWLQLRRPAKKRDFLGMPASPGQAIWAALMRIPSRHFRGTERMKLELDSITRLFHQKPSPIESIRVVHHLQGLLLEILECSRRPIEPSRSASIQSILDHIHGNLSGSFPVGPLAAQAGLSEARFNRRFKEETGMPPAEYILRAKIGEAHRRLESGPGLTVTKVAYDLGFSSSQYFATAFRRLVGLSPRDVRRRLASTGGHSGNAN